CQIRENDIELHLVEVGEGIRGTGAEIDLPMEGKLPKNSAQITGFDDIISYYQNSSQFVHVRRSASRFCDSPRLKLPTCQLPRFLLTAPPAGAAPASELHVLRGASFLVCFGAPIPYDLFHPSLRPYRAH